MSLLVDRLRGASAPSDAARAWAAALDALALPRDARVGLYLPLADLLDATVATLACGLVAVPLSLRLGPRPLAYHLEEAGVSTLLTATEHLATVRAAEALAPTRPLVIDLASWDRHASARPVVRERAARDEAFVSHAPEIPGGLPIGLVHDHEATLTAAEGVADALSLDTSDVLTVDLPLWEGALVLAIAARLRGARVAADAARDTTVLVTRARDAAASATRLLDGHAPLRAVIGVGPLAHGAVRDLSRRAPRIELASVLVVRELPLWLRLDRLAPAEAGRLVPGTLRGLEPGLEGEAITVRGEALPRARAGADLGGRIALEAGRLVSHDRGARDARGAIVLAAPSPERTALDVLDAHLPPLSTSAHSLREAVARRDLPYPIGCGRGASIALELGLKPMLRELIAVPDLETARARFERDGFAVEISPMVVGATHDGWLGRPESREGTARDAGDDRRPVYVGHDRARLRQAVEAELARTLEGARTLGLLLGYPACCVEAFVSAGSDRRAQRLWAAAAGRTEGPFAARLNALDHAVFSYVSWFPCRFDCAPSLALADALATEIERRHPELVRAIDRALGAPRLVLAPEVQLVIEGSVRGRSLARVKALRAGACDRDPRVRVDPRESDVTARALAWLAGSETMGIQAGALVVDGAARALPLEAPLPLLLPFAPRA
jgi:hypothetical protein